jgi:hypothetical protein
MFREHPGRLTFQVAAMTGNDSGHNPHTRVRIEHFYDKGISKHFYDKGISKPLSTSTSMRE